MGRKVPDLKPPRYLRRRRRLHERFVKKGLESFAEHEVMELLLTFAMPRADVKQPAKRLLAEFGRLRAVLDASLDELTAVHGIGPVAATGLHVIRAAATAYLRQTAEGRALLEPRDLINFWRLHFDGLRHEAFAIGYLDAGYRLLPDGVEILQQGTIDHSVICPRDVVAGALKREAAALMLAHNHPHGDVEPTESDRHLTDVIATAAETVDARVVDHVVVSAATAFSFRAMGWL